jgi:hypothetical protein
MIMKNVSFIFALLLSVSAFLTSCTQKDDQKPGNDYNAAKSTQIEGVEASLSINLIKKYQTITDDQGNSVTLLVASKKAEIIDNFLNNTDISIEVLPSFTPPGSTDGIQVTAGLGEEEQQEDANGLLLEVASKKFGDNTKAFTLKFRGKSVVGSDGKIVDRALLEENESQLFIEGFMIDYLTFNCNNGCNDDILVEHWSRACALCSYKKFASRSLNPGEGWDSCNDARRTKCKIFGDYPRSFYSWNFTFWNCA